MPKSPLRIARHIDLPKKIVHDDELAAIVSVAGDPPVDPALSLELALSGDDVTAAEAMIGIWLTE